MQSWVKSVLIPFELTAATSAADAGIRKESEDLGLLIQELLI